MIFNIRRDQKTDEWLLSNNVTKHIFVFKVKSDAELMRKILKANPAVLTGTAEGTHRTRINYNPSN